MDTLERDDDDAPRAKVKKQSGFAKTVNGIATKRNFIIAGVIILLAFLIFGRGCSGPKKPISELGTNPPATDASDLGRQAPHVAEKVRAQDQEMADRLTSSAEMMQSGTSFTPQLTRESNDPLADLAQVNPGFTAQQDADSGGRNVAVPPKLMDPGLTPPPSSRRQAQRPSGPPASPTPSPAESLLNRGALDLLEIMQAISENRDKRLDATRERMLAVGPVFVAPTPEPEDPASAPGASGAELEPSVDIMAQTGSMLYAILDLEANSDSSPFVQATVVGGPYDGAKLQGGFTPLGEALEITFQTLVYDGTYAIDAIAVNPDQPKVGLATEVNKHYLSRFGGLFAAAALRGAGEEVKRSGSTTVVNLNGGTAIDSRERAGGREIGFSALGEVGLEAANVLRDGINRPPTIKVAAGTPVGVIFRQDWTVSNVPSGRRITETSQGLAGASARGAR